MHLQYSPSLAFNVTPKITQFQEEANQLSIDITNFFHDYEHNANLHFMNEAQIAHEDLIAAITVIHAREVEIRAILWLTGSSDCFEVYTDKLDSIIQVAGNEIAECSIPHTKYLNNATRFFVENFRQFQFIPIDLQTIAITGIADTNPLTKPDDTVYVLKESLQSIEQNYLDYVLPTLEQNFEELVIALEEIYNTYSECMTIPVANFNKSADMIENEINSCEV